MRYKDRELVFQVSCVQRVCVCLMLCHEAPEKNNSFNPRHPAKLGAQAEERRKTSLWLSARDDLLAIIRSALSRSCDRITSFFHFHLSFLFFFEGDNGHSILACKAASALRKASNHSRCLVRFLDPDSQY